MSVENNQHFNTEFPHQERLSEEVVGSLLATLGNNEAKAITFIAMRPNMIYDSKALDAAIRQIQGNVKAGWNMGYEAPFHYCQKSFEPVGLVVREVLDEVKNSYGFAKTQYGSEIGVPFAGKMLQLSYKYPEISLYDLFGNTSSSSNAYTSEEGLYVKKRSPLTRVRLFRELLSSPLPLQITDLAGKIGETDESLITRHLKQLNRLGIIESDGNIVDSISRENKQLLFEVVSTFQKFVDIDVGVIEEGRFFASYLLTNPNVTATLMRKAKEHSRNANQVPIQQTAEEVIIILQRTPGLTTEQVKKRLEDEFGHTLSEHRVRRIIKYALKQRGITPPKRAKLVRWTLEE